MHIFSVWLYRVQERCCVWDCREPECFVLCLPGLEGSWRRALDVRKMGGCQNYGPFLGTLDIRCRKIIGIQKGTIILTTTQILTILDILIYYASCYGCYVHFCYSFPSPCSQLPWPSLTRLLQPNSPMRGMRYQDPNVRLLGNLLHLVRNEGHVHA